MKFEVEHVVLGTTVFLKNLREQYPENTPFFEIGQTGENKWGVVFIKFENEEPVMYELVCDYSPEQIVDFFQPLDIDEIKLLQF